MLTHHLLNPQLGRVCDTLRLRLQLRTYKKRAQSSARSQRLSHGSEQRMVTERAQVLEARGGRGSSSDVTPALRSHVRCKSENVIRFTNAHSIWLWHSMRMLSARARASALACPVDSTAAVIACSSYSCNRNQNRDELTSKNPAHSTLILGQQESDWCARLYMKYANKHDFPDMSDGSPRNEHNEQGAVLS